MAEKKTAHTAGYDKYEDVDAALEKMKNGWSEVGKTNRYSTGFPILDEYLGGGYGSTVRGEVVLMHATAKTYKSTFAIQFIRGPLEKGEKVGLIVLEGKLDNFLTELRKLYAPVQEGDKVVGYEKFDAISDKISKQIFAMSDEMLKSNFRMDEIVPWMKKAVVQHGVKLFLIDPIGYIPDFAEMSNVPDFKRESKLMKEISDFAYDTCSTVICIQHNVKDGDYLHPAHRQAAVGGSQSYTKSATKVIEIRNEGLINDQDRNSGKYISLEMYMARGVPDWRGRPVIIEVTRHPDGKGVLMRMNKYDRETGDALLADPKKRDDRWLWFGQIKGDLDELVEGL